jgi:hypothetical protein
LDRFAVFGRRCLEREAFVEFREGNGEADFRHVEGVVVGEDEDDPSVLRAGIDGGADAILFEHDIALDGWSGLIFAGFDDAVVGRGARGLEPRR